MKTKSLDAVSIVAMPLLDNLHAKQLRYIARTLKIPIGKSRANTTASILNAIQSGKATVRLTGYLLQKVNDPKTPLVDEKLIAMKTLRT